ncbi:uncharacterized protein LOC115441646 [Manduca sexta]|uniref:Ecdysis-triggering hormone n=1 Tax=Manduca sexta TaxID=7130 RepID=Q9U9K3_MANSE|nr:uncharacterized protein LOC115441646 [Manduca sexta]AAD45613.1 ecdysis-triggering hormone precursor [Manduca sexta]KAG6447237.1 hypothetical protein O3G_MSEX004859 [Manduca sexta]
MAFRVTKVLTALCLVCLFLQVESSFIKPNNVPRVGRSNEAISPFDQGMMGYVIKTNKNIPRMGRRNYDSENRFDIPKLYPWRAENTELYEDDAQPTNGEEINGFYGKQRENMKR